MVANKQPALTGKEAEKLFHLLETIEANLKAKISSTKSTPLINELEEKAKKLKKAQESVNKGKVSAAFIKKYLRSNGLMEFSKANGINGNISTGNKLSWKEIGIGAGILGAAAAVITGAVLWGPALLGAAWGSYIAPAVAGIVTIGTGIAISGGGVAAVFKSLTDPAMKTIPKIASVTLAGGIASLPVIEKTSGGGHISNAMYNATLKTLGGKPSQPNSLGIPPADKRGRPLNLGSVGKSSAAHIAQSGTLQDGSPVFEYKGNWSETTKKSSDTNLVAAQQKNIGNTFAERINSGRLKTTSDKGIEV